MSVPLDINSGKSKRPEIMGVPGMDASINLPAASLLQNRVNAMVEKGKWGFMKGSTEEAIKRVGTAKYERAGDVTEDYRRTVDHLGQYFAAPANYEQLRVNVFALMHEFVGPADRKSAERIMSEVPPYPKKDEKGKVMKNDRGEVIETTLLTEYKTQREQLGNISGEEKARHLKASLDVLNSANRYRYDFAKKHGLMDEFGFTKGKDGEKTDLPVQSIEDPRELTKTLDECDRAHSGHMYSVSMDEHGVQKKKLETRPDWKDTAKHIFGALVTAEVSTEFGMGLMAGRAGHWAFTKLAMMAGLTDRASRDAKTISVGNVRQVETLRSAMVAPLAGNAPKPTPKPEAILQGPSTHGNLSYKKADGGGIAR